MPLSNLTRVLQDQRGAVTADWVVLTAATVGLGLASAAAVRTGVGDLGAEIETSLTNASVALVLSGSTLVTYQYRMPLDSAYMVDLIASIQGMTDQDLLDAYTSRMAWIEERTANGTLVYTPIAQSRFDTAHLAYVEMQNRGIAIPDGVANIVDVWAATPFNPANP